LDLAAVSIDNVPANGQAEAGSSVLASCKEGFEYVWEIFR